MNRPDLMQQAARLPADPLGDTLAAIVSALRGPERAATMRADRHDARVMAALTYQRATGTVI